MTREEALQIADQLVTEWSGQVKNERGYVHDKWQPVDLPTRTESVLRVADWLLAGETRLVSPVQVPSEALRLPTERLPG